MNLDRTSLAKNTQFNNFDESRFQVVYASAKMNHFTLAAIDSVVLVESKIDHKVGTTRILFLVV